MNKQEYMELKKKQEGINNTILRYETLSNVKDRCSDLIIKIGYNDDKITGIDIHRSRITLPNSLEISQKLGIAIKEVLSAEIEDINKKLEEITHYE